MPSVNQVGRPWSTSKKARPSATTCRQLGCSMVQRGAGGYNAVAQKTQVLLAVVLQILGFREL